MFFTTPFQPCREPKYRLAAFIKGKKGAKSEKQKQRAMGQALGFNVDDQASCCCRQTQRLTSANLACKRNGDWSLKKNELENYEILIPIYTYIFIQQVLGNKLLFLALEINFLLAKQMPQKLFSIILPPFSRLREILRLSWPFSAL